MSAPTWSNERRKLSELIPWPRNPRQIKGESVRRLQESFEEFGQPEVIAISPANEVYNGHQRLKSWAAKFGDIEVDVRVSSRPLTEKERERLTVLLHRGAVGEWDFDMLANEFEVGELLDWGFTEMELGLDGGAANNVDAEPQIDRAEELNEKWQVQPCDLWRIGEHRLICGDCTDAAVVERVMGGERADFFVTDPPYVLQAASDKASKADENDQALRHFLRNAWLGAIAHMQPHAGAVWFCNWRTIDCVRTATRTRNEKNYQVAVWYKGRSATPGTPWMNTVEMLLFYCLDGYNHQKATGLDNFVSIQWGGGTRAYHPAEKPVEVYKYAMTPMNVGDLVFDPFLGSGTTLIACENLGRRCLAVEIDLGYVAVALERFHQHSGKVPVLVSGE